MARKKSVADPGTPVSAPSGPAKKPSVYRRVRSWYSTKERRHRIVFWVAVVLLLAVLVEVAIQAGLTLHSIRNDDLVLFVESANESVSLTKGESTTLSYTLGTRNLWFCSATCNWSITDLSTQTVLDSGTGQFTSGNKQVYSAVVSARPGEHVVPYQFYASCSTNKALYCKSSAGLREAATLTIVNSEYTPAEKEAFNELSVSLAGWTNNTTYSLHTLAGLAELPDKRAQPLLASAKEEFYLALERFTSVQRSLASADVLEANAIVQTPLQQTAVDQYDAMQAQEVALVSAFGQLSAYDPLVKALTSVMDNAQRQQLANLFYALPKTQLHFTNQTLSQTQQQLDVFMTAVEQAKRTYELPTINLASQGRTLLEQEQRMACTIKGGPCPVVMNSTTNLVDAVASLRQTCTSIDELPVYFADAQSALLNTLDPTATQEQLEAQYDVAAIRADSDFNATEQLALASARNGALPSVNASMRLAFRLQLSPQALAFVNASCSFGQQLSIPDISLAASLPQQPFKQLVLPAITLPQKECCTIDSCGTCNQAPYPVLFVHGHSFALDTSPEGSVSAFVPIATELQKNSTQGDYLYAGSAFPREDVDTIPAAEFGEVPSTLLFTTTYYYDSYPEKGTVSLVPQKSENIENYALRLREAVEVVKHKTGSDKVVIVAHSMGGLVARRYMQIFDDTSVAALVMIGTPNNGITARTETVCPLLGSESECEDMVAGSLFLSKLNGGKKPAIPVFTIAGAGCKGDGYDGVVYTNSVSLDFANNTIVNGTCSGTTLLHNTLLDPQIHPEVYEEIEHLISIYVKK